jgi:hypothetical protein
MKDALLRKGNKKSRISAVDAAKNGKTKAYCEACEEQVNLHTKRKPSGSPTHWEHQAGSRTITNTCPNHFRPKAV